MHAHTHTKKNNPGHPLTHAVLEEPEDVGGEGDAHIALGGIWIVQESQLQRDVPLPSEINGLDHLVGGPVPHVEAAAVLALAHVAGVEALQEALGVPPPGAHHHIVPRLVPEVVTKLSAVARGLPVALDLERLPIDQEKASYQEKKRKKRESKHEKYLHYILYCLQ